MFVNHFSFSKLNGMVLDNFSVLVIKTSLLNRQIIQTSVAAVDG